jgi:UDP-glucose 4-epimerase
MRAIVTGGAGFIGSHVVDSLIANADEVLVIDDLSRGNVDNLKGAISEGSELVELDIRDGAGIERTMRSFRPQVVFHLAAQIDVRTSMNDPATDASVNVLGSINVFTAAYSAGAGRVVNTSTGGAIYGDEAPVPTPEDAPAGPVSAYGLSKHTVERYATWFRTTRRLDVVTLRYGNVYGPRQDPRGDAGVIAIFCDRLLAGERLTIYGDGRQTRDYVFVSDVAAANLAVARQVDLRHGEYNIGTGTEISVLELADSVAVVVGQDPSECRHEFAPARQGELLRSCLDVRRARREFSLSTPTPLPVGLSQTVQWMRTKPGSE